MKATAGIVDYMAKMANGAIRPDVDEAVDYLLKIGQGVPASQPALMGPPAPIAGPPEPLMGPPNYAGPPAPATMPAGPPPVSTTLPAPVGPPPAPTTQPAAPGFLDQLKGQGSALWDQMKGAYGGMPGWGQWALKGGLGGAGLMALLSLLGGSKTPIQNILLGLLTGGALGGGIPLLGEAWKSRGEARKQLAQQNAESIVSQQQPQGLGGLIKNIAPKEALRDEAGQLVLDANGNPIMQPDARRTGRNAAMGIGGGLIGAGIHNKVAPIQDARAILNASNSGATPIALADELKVPIDELYNRAFIPGYEARATGSGKVPGKLGSAWFRLKRNLGFGLDKYKPGGSAFDDVFSKPSLQQLGVNFGGSNNLALRAEAIKQLAAENNVLGTAVNEAAVQARIQQLANQSGSVGQVTPHNVKQRGVALLSDPALRRQAKAGLYPTRWKQLTQPRNLRIGIPAIAGFLAGPAGDAAFKWGKGS